MVTASFPDIPSAPHQPRSITLPKQSFGKKTIVFQASWFTMWKWIHYNEMNNKAFCFYCVKRFKEKQVDSSLSKNQALIS